MLPSRAAATRDACGNLYTAYAHVPELRFDIRHFSTARSLYFIAEIFALLVTVVSSISDSAGDALQVTRLKL